MRARVVVSGLIAQHPELGGMTWHYLQYLVGLANLGHDVFYLEDSGEWPYRWHGGDRPEDWLRDDVRPNVEHLRSVLDRFGFGDRWCYRVATDGEWYGMSTARRDEVLSSADVVLNVSGSLEHPDRHRPRAGTLAYIDSDPVFTQLHVRTGGPAVHDRLAAHDVHLSFGEHVERLPPTPFSWQPTRQPIVLDLWADEAPPGSAFTTVMNWTSYEPITYEGRRYGQKDVEFLSFLELPTRVPSARFEIAMPHLAHDDWTGADLDGAVDAVLRGAGWQPVDALERCCGADAYRRFILSSRAEWTVVKNGYRRGAAGWFSERSACYLASGRAVVTQDAGYDGLFPAGEGLLTFTDLDEAVAAVTEVQRRPEHHGRAARDLAREHFDAGRVLTRLLERIDGSR